MVWAATEAVIVPIGPPALVDKPKLTPLPLAKVMAVRLLLVVPALKLMAEINPSVVGAENNILEPVLVVLSPIEAPPKAWRLTLLASKVIPEVLPTVLLDTIADSVWFVCVGTVYEPVIVPTDAPVLNPKVKPLELAKVRPVTAVLLVPAPADNLIPEIRPAVEGTV